MRKILGFFGALLLLTSFHCHAAGFFPGAWYCTKAPDFEMRWGGGIDVFFYGDKTMDVDFAVGSDYFYTIQSTYTVDRYGNFQFTFEDADGWIYTGTCNVSRKMVKGTFRSPVFNWPGIFKGKFQCGFTESDDAADAKKAAKRTYEGRKKLSR
jgi:hypothetical protein